MRDEPTSDESGRVSAIYSLRETPEARQQLDAIALQSNQFQNIWGGITWLILRQPDAGELIPGRTQTYMLKTTDFLAIGIPVLLVIYSIVDCKELVLEVISVLNK